MGYTMQTFKLRLAPILDKIPLYSVGIGWLVPGIIGIGFGYIVSKFQKQEIAVEK